MEVGRPARCTINFDARTLEAVDKTTPASWRKCQLLACSNSNHLVIVSHFQIFSCSSIWQKYRKLKLVISVFEKGIYHK